MESLPLGISTSEGVISFLLVLLASMVYGLWKALSSGALATSRELAEKDKRIALQDRMLSNRDHQLSLILTEAMTTISPVLKAMRAAADSDEESDRT